MTRESIEFITPQIEPLLTPEEAANMLGVKAATLQTWRARNRYPLKYVKIGSSVRYRQCDLVEFVNSRLSDCESVTA